VEQTCHGKRPSRLTPLIALALLLLVSFGLGGGGSYYGLANLIVQLTALAVLSAHRDSFIAFWRTAPMALRGLIILTILVPLIQLMPLPSSLWTALPGRELVAASLGQAGEAGWMPISLDPRRTLLALTALIVPLSVLAIGWTMPRQDLVSLGWIVVMLGLVTLLIGAVQVSSNGQAGLLYPQRMPGSVLLGTFANRNSTGLMLILPLTLAALLPSPRPHPAALPVRLALCALLILAIILTKSRTALVLSAIPILLGLARAALFSAETAARRSAGKPSRGWLIAVAVFALGTAGIAGTIAMAPGRLAETLERFEGSSEDSRRYIWEDATHSAARYWPVGAGMGTFDDISAVDESLENLTKRRPGRVHNDFIEITIEAGIVGIILVILWFALIAWLAWRVRASSWRWPAWGAAGFLLAIALQSITDYPLRNQTILFLASFALLLLTRVAAHRRERMS
jgi:O-antigen ligase